MTITAIECHVLVVPDLKEDATSSSQDNLVVLVQTDDGITGVGETDTGPWLARAAIEAPGSHSMAMSLKDVYLGQDPFETTALWDRAYEATCMSGRSGPVLCAMGAIDMALWDIKGKAVGKPVYKLLGGAVQKTITPYASLQPEGTNVKTYTQTLVSWAKKAKKAGFRAGKMECTLNGPYRHQSLRGTDEQATEVVRAVREAVGKDFALMVDVQYLWRDAPTCLRTVSQWADLDIYFLETPLRVDNLEGYAQLAREAPMRIAAGEWLNSRHEFRQLLDVGRVDVAQPDVGRCGGFTESMRVCHMAEDRGRQIVPHCWKTGIGIAATAHLAFAIPHCPFIEYLPASLCDSALRRDLCDDGLTFKDGVLLPPTKPGLGIDLDIDALKKYRAKPLTI